MPPTTTSIPIACVLVITLGTPFAAGQSSGSSQSEEADSISDALSKGRPSVNLRYRYELVDDEDFDKHAHASTLRTTLGYRTAPFKGFSLFLEAQNVTHVGKQRFNNRGADHLANDVLDRPVVADPSQTRMQQAYLRFDAFDTDFDLGRRQIAFGDHRFVGDIAWRQNFQTFDAIYFSNASIDRTTVSYAFADKVVRIFGDEKEMSSHLVNVLVGVNPNISVELFAYLLDYDAFGDRGLSSQSYGGKLSGSRPVDERLRVLYEAQYARQTDFGDNPNTRDATYLHLMGGLGIGDFVNVKAARELLSGSRADGAFQTPLATGHKFNGWADLFLVTPVEGLVDWYVSADGKIRSLSWSVVYHDFSADEGSRPYGSEIDAQMLHPTPWNMPFGVKVAFYREDGFARDVTKLWLWTQYSF